MVYSVSVVAVTNHHTLSGLLHQNAILLGFWKSEVWAQFLQAARGAAGLAASDGSVGERVSLPFFSFQWHLCSLA